MVILRKLSFENIALNNPTGRTHLLFALQPYLLYKFYFLHTFFPQKVGGVTTQIALAILSELFTNLCFCVDLK